MKVHANILKSCVLLPSWGPSEPGLMGQSYKKQRHLPIVPSPGGMALNSRAVAMSVPAKGDYAKETQKF